MTTENVNTVTGEIIPAEEFSGRSIGNEIVAINQGTAAFYSSIKGDDMESRLAVASAISNAEPLSDHLNEALSIKDVVIQEVELENDVTGALEKAPRVTLILEDGSALAATSIGIFSSIKQLIGVVGEPETWKRPVEMFAVEQKARKSTGKFMTLKYGKPVKK